MNMKNKATRTFWIHAMSSLHVGTERGVGYIDLPVAREKVTSWPYIPGSGIKGVIADHFNASTDEARVNDDLRRAAFGLGGGAENTNAGSLVFGDAHIVCLPVRSFFGTFAWATSPFCLRRLARDLGLAKLENFSEGGVLEKGEAVVFAESALTDKDGRKIFLEDLDIQVKSLPNVPEAADCIATAVFGEDTEWKKQFFRRFAVLDDDTFTFLCESGTEVNPRIRIEEKTKIVKDGALWYEESLPPETILAGALWCDRIYGKKDSAVTREKLLEEYCTKPLPLQIGGKASIGKGQVRCLFGE